MQRVLMGQVLHVVVDIILGIFSGTNKERNPDNDNSDDDKCENTHGGIP